LQIDEFGAIKNELNKIKTIVNKPGFLLSWDIIQDLCNMALDVRDVDKNV